MNLCNLDPELVSNCDELIQFRSWISDTCDELIQFSELVSTCDELMQFRSRISVYLWWTYTI